MKITYKQSVLIKRTPEGKLKNLLRVSISEAEGDSVRVSLNGSMQEEQPLVSGCADFAFWPEEPAKKHQMIIQAEDCCGEAEEVAVLDPPKHYTLHFVHSSHHDPGYTDLMSHVFRSHYHWIDSILDAFDTPWGDEDTRLRISLEQFWSLEYYLEHAPADKVAKVKKLIREGRIELTALYGNLITEQLGHEECYRALYPAKKLADQCGIGIKSAMHNDVPGISQGLCRALCDCGITFLAADFPQYYDWGYENLVSFWEPEKIYGYQGPGAFTWEAADGKSLILWNSNALICEKWDEAWIEETLGNLGAYPYEVFRATLKAGNIDNSRYYAEYCTNALEWNRTYCYPHIVISTNERFASALVENGRALGITMPKVKGEMPGQDYPVGAMSMAQITSSARKTQNRLTTAEKLLALAAEDALLPDQKELLEEAWRDLLLSDDHLYGYQFSAGPAMKASFWEKGARAMRAEATVQDLTDKALASIADRIAPTGAPFRLVVFNPCSQSVTAPVETVLREADNCGTILCTDNHDPNHLKGYLLNNRRRVNPPEEVWRDSRFTLIDEATGQSVPYFIDDLAWDEPQYYAPEYNGLGSGTKRYGFFEHPGGMKRVLKFKAKEVPAFGYKSYALMPGEDVGSATCRQQVRSISNEWYRIEIDEKGICSLVDLRSGRELIDQAAGERPGDILVRTAREEKTEQMKVTGTEAFQNEIFSEVRIYATVDGAYEVCVKFTLWQGINRVDAAVHMLRSAKPLQTMYIAFPFVGDRFTYQGVLNELEPVKDFLPGAQSDVVTVKDYVKVHQSGILWSSADTAAVSLGKLWRGYISPAHSCIMECEHHTPLREEDYTGGRIYAILTANNFGTNFMCSQAFDGVYKFSFAVCEESEETACALWGEQIQNPLLTQFTDRSRGNLNVSDSLFDTGGLHCLSLNMSDVGEVITARVWNHSDEYEKCGLIYKGKKVSEATVCDGVEREMYQTDDITIEPKTVMTIKFRI